MLEVWGDIFLRRFRHSRGGLLGLLVLASLAGPAQAQEAPSDSTRPGTRRLVIESGDVLTGERVGGQEVRRLRGNARLRMETTTFFAASAIKYPDRALLERNVVIVDEGDTLNADRVLFREATKIGEATGNVRLSDGGAVLFAPSGLYAIDPKLATFEEGVRLVDSTSVLTSRRGTYGTESKVAVFFDEVDLRQDDLWLEADSLRHDRRAGTSQARGRVMIEQIGGGEDEARVDSTTRTFLFGEQVNHDNEARRSRVEGLPLLVQLQPDSTGADTLLIRARVLDAVRRDSLERLVATDSVRIWQTDLSALADSAVYEKRRRPRRPGATTTGPTDTLRPGTEPISPDFPERMTTVPPPDSLKVDSLGNGSTTTDSTASELYETLWLHGRPTIWVGQAQVTGDSIRVTLRDGVVDSLYVDGNAFVAQEDTVSGRIQQMRGRKMRGRFEHDSLRTLRVGPNAEALYFRIDEEAGTLEQAIQLSADDMLFLLERGEITDVKAYQGIESAVYEADAVPDPFQLNGFRWTPERRPRQAEFFRDVDRIDRLRRRLEAERPPPEPVTTEGPTPIDSR